MKSHMGFLLVPTAATLNDFEGRLAVSELTKLAEEANNYLAGYLRHKCNS